MSTHATLHHIFLVPVGMWAFNFAAVRDQINRKVDAFLYLVRIETRADTLSTTYKIAKHSSMVNDFGRRYNFTSQAFVYGTRTNLPTDHPVYILSARPVHNLQFFCKLDLNSSNPT